VSGHKKSTQAKLVFGHRCVLAKIFHSDSFWELARPELDARTSFASISIEGARLPFFDTSGHSGKYPSVGNNLQRAPSMSSNAFTN